MTSVSISELKANPRKAISASLDFPLPVKNRDKTEAYLIGKGLFEKMVVFIENHIDKRAIEKADYTKGTNLDDLVKELGLE